MCSFLIRFLVVRVYNRHEFIAVPLDTIIQFVLRLLDTVKPVCNDHLYKKNITRDLFNNVLQWRPKVPSYYC